MAENKNDKTGKRVLFFDDEPFITKAQASSLKLLGWDVTQVSEIDELFKELKDSKFDVIILDFMAPLPNEINKNIDFTPEEIEAMDEGRNAGVVLAKKIWAKDSTQLILFLSARQLSEEAKNVFNHSGYTWSFLRKPELTKTVNDELEKLLIRNNTRS